MKASFLFLLLIAGPCLAQTGTGLSGGEPYTVTSEKQPVDTSQVYRFADEFPEFPGGPDAMRMFINKNISYPEKVAKRKVKGKCYMRFVVVAEGNIRNVQVMRGIEDCPECNQEAIRLIKLMPRWKPGKIDGKAVKSYYTIPVNFELH